MQNLSGETFLFAQQPQQQMLSSDVLVIQPFGFFGAISQDALALVAERKIDGGGDFLSNGSMRFNLLTNRFDGGVGAQKTIGQRLVFPQQAQQQVLGLDVGASKLAGFVARKENHAARLLGITFKHNSRYLSTLSVVLGRTDRVECCQASRGPKSPYPTVRFDRTARRRKGYE